VQVSVVQRGSAQEPLIVQGDFSQFTHNIIKKVIKCVILENESYIRFWSDLTKLIDFSIRIVSSRAFARAKNLVVFLGGKDKNLVINSVINIISYIHVVRTGFWVYWNWADKKIISNFLCMYCFVNSFCYQKARKTIGS